MIDFFLMLFASPEAQSDPHYWASTMLAHSMIGAMLTVLIPSHWVVVALYVAWETGQMALSGAGLSDSLLDAAAFILGTYLVLASRAEQRLIVLAISIVAAAGTLVRHGNLL